jgi:hypothetical protein
MTLVQLAGEVFGKAEALGVPHMGVGALAAGVYGIPRATKDIDLLVSVDVRDDLPRLMEALDDLAEFDGQAHFDTITWGRRHIGVSRSSPPIKIELFETFDDPFVRSEFARRSRKFVAILDRSIWLPTAEDVVVQKLRWGRPKDLEDARDVLAVQGSESLDMPYIRRWCAEHRTTPRLDDILVSIPPM